MGVFNGAANYDNDYDDIAEEGAHRFTGRGGWSASPTNIGWRRSFRASRAASTRRSSTTRGPTPSSPRSRPPRSSSRRAPPRPTSHLFAGAKEIRYLDAYSEALGTPLERAIDWGWFRWFMQAIYALLNWLFALIGNFGVAIILLTVIVRLICSRSPRSSSSRWRRCASRSPR